MQQQEVSRDRISPKLWRITYWDGTEEYFFFCPGCNHGHHYQVPRWKFNGDVNKPTFTPSLMHRYFEERDGKQVQVVCCHLFLTNGMLQFLEDCPHELRGVTVEIPDWPANYQLI